MQTIKEEPVRTHHFYLQHPPSAFFFVVSGRSWRPPELFGAPSAMRRSFTSLAIVTNDCVCVDARTYNFTVHARGQCGVMKDNGTFCAKGFVPPRH